MPLRRPRIVHCHLPKPDTRVARLQLRFEVENTSTWALAAAWPLLIADARLVLLLIHL